MIPDRFIYSLLPIPFLILTIVIFIVRKDLRRRIIKVGLIGGVAGWAANIWYFIDYWRPPSLFGQTVFSIEDFVTGFALAAVGVTLWPLLTGHPYVKSVKGSKRKPLLWFTLAGIAYFVLLVNVFKVGSPVATLSLVLIPSIVMIVRKPRLLKQALVVGGILVVISFIDYFFLFHVFSTGYLQRYFLMTDRWYDPSILGFYPFLEAAWYFTWGVFATVFVDYFARPDVAKNETKASKALS